MIRSTAIIPILILVGTVLGQAQGAPSRKLPNHDAAQLSRALFVAIDRNNTVQIKVLLKQGADPNIIGVPQGNAQTEWQPALVLATEGHHANVVGMLLGSGANPDAADARGDTALMFAATLGEAMIVRLLLAKGANVNAQDGYGVTALSNAVDAGNSETALLLLRGAANPSLADKTGQTPLMEAAHLAHPAIIRALLAHSANVNQIDTDGGTALMEASAPLLDEPADLLPKKLQSVKLLLVSGANVNARDNQGRTAAMNTAYRGVPPDPNSDRPGLDVSRAHLDILKVLFAAGADLHVRDIWGESLFLKAALFGNTAISEFLLAHGADVNLKDNSGLTVLDRATLPNAIASPELVKVLKAAKPQKGPADASSPSAP